MSFLIITAGILLLLFLTLRKVSPFLALLIVSLLTGLTLGMPFAKVTASIQAGVGSTLGSMALILCMGAMLGKILQVSGAAGQISNYLIKKFGKNNVQWAVLITGFLVGIPLFYNAGFVILVPIVFSIAKESGVSILQIAIPMAASLSVTHGFLPPHPGPLGLASVFKADVGKILLYGIIIAIPTVIIAGPLFSKLLKGIDAKPSAPFLDKNENRAKEIPSAFVSFLMALLPVLLIAVAALINLFSEEKNRLTEILIFLGDPVVALLLSVLTAGYLLGMQKGKTISEVMLLFGDAVAGIAMIMMIIAAGGAFKQVLTDSGVGDEIAALAKQYQFSPLIAGWLIAAILRVTLGSATVAGLMAAGIVLPVLAGSNTNPELMVLSVGAGSLMFSHVNDTGFWMFKEYFNLTLKQTFLSWSIMETIVSVMGLLGVLLLNSFL
jgi:Gnt-I system high-affinity gluconate transporter